MAIVLAALLCALSAVSQVSEVAAAEENVFGTSTVQSSALRGELYYLPETAANLPDFASLTSVGAVYAKVLDIPPRSFESGFPGVTDRFEWFAIRYTGTFNVETEGDYGFRLLSDDGSRLLIDGNLIIDNDGIHPPRSASGNVHLAPGRHQIEVDYFQGPRYEIALQLFWTPPGEEESISNPGFVPTPGGGPGTGTGATGGATGAGAGAGTINLTGVWSCDDGGTYYIRQLADAVWWLGELAAMEPSWCNVASGTISGSTVVLDYADVPKGEAIGFGTLILNVVSNDELRATSKPDSYGGSIWRRISGPSPGVVPGGGISGGVTTGTVTGPGAHPWDDPGVRQLIDEWIAQQDSCVKQVYPNAYVDRWGRICGETQTAVISCTLTPDRPADWDSYHYLWANNWCPSYYPYTVQDYVSLRQDGLGFDDLAECKGREEMCYS
jgi:hypothetical protein